MPRHLTYSVVAIPVLALVTALPAGAGPREDAAAAMARCDLIKDNAGWLECHEKATAQMRAALSVKPGSPAAAPPNAGAVNGHFGEENLPRQQARGMRAPKRLVARVQDISFSQNGYFTVGLDNGQWWRQVDGDTSYARFRSPANRNVVTIERGFLGSYNLHIKGLSTGYKVNRLR